MHASFVHLFLHKRCLIGLLKDFLAELECFVQWACLLDVNDLLKLLFDFLRLITVRHRLSCVLPLELISLNFLFPLLLAECICSRRKLS